jgi:ApbE superfamily uncharacterized protein (UPF0280 family)
LLYTQLWGLKIYNERFYRSNFATQRFHPLCIQEGESDIWIGWNARGETVDHAELQNAAEKILSSLRKDILEYAKQYPYFLTALEPIPQNDKAPAIIFSMTAAAHAADVGPRASVAGALAEYLGKMLDDQFHFEEIVVENGGDFWLKIQSPLSIGVYAGLSSLSQNLAVVLHPENTPVGLACSSGTVGPSLSYGKADASLVIAKSAAAADAWATALGNRAKSKNDLEEALALLFDGAGKYFSHESLKPLGALLIMGDTMAARGNIILGPAQK